MKTTGISCVTKFRLLFFLGHPNLQIGVKHDKTQNLLHKSQSLIKDDWANSTVRWTPKKEGWLPDWGNEGKLLGRLDKGRHPVSRMCTVVHGSLDTWKSCTSPTPTMELKMMEIKKSQLATKVQRVRNRQWKNCTDKRDEDEDEVEDSGDAPPEKRAAGWWLWGPGFCCSPANVVLCRSNDSSRSTISIPGRCA